jgi:hypothetical protein
MEPQVTAGNSESFVIKLTLDPETAQKLLAKKPRTLPMATFCALVLEQSLTEGARLPAYCVGAGNTDNLSTEQVVSTPASAEYSLEDELKALQAVESPAPQEFSLQTSVLFLGDGVGRESEGTPRKDPSLVCVPPAKAPRKHVRREYTPEFQQFWNVYQTCPIKANSQSKPLAFEAWKEAIQAETPERVIEATRRVVEQAKQAKIQDDWFAPLPDAFRWLRDERYAVLLEDHVPAGPRVINGITIYD